MRCHKVPELGTAGVSLSALSALHSASCLAVKAVAEDGLLCTASVGGQVRTEVQFKTFVTPKSWADLKSLKVVQGDLSKDPHRKEISSTGGSFS